MIPTYADIAQLMPNKTDWHRIKKSDPYSYTIEAGDHRLYYFGANHSHDPENHQYPVLSYFWDRFVATENKDKVVMVEGGLRRLADSLEEAIIKDGESGYVTYAAHQLDIPVICPEPSEVDERAYLQQQFTQDEIQLYYFVRLIQPWHRKGQEWSFADFYHTYYGDTFADYAKENLPGWESYDFSAEHMIDVYQKVYDRVFNPDDLDWGKRIVSHAITEYATNRLSAECSRFRDISIVSQIITEWQTGKNIFVTFGLSHAVFQEAALRKILPNG